jgi:hypothetical protein
VTLGDWEGSLLPCESATRAVFSMAALIAATVYIRRHQLPPLPTADVFAPGIALGHGIGRLGCFAAGCCWGVPTKLPWGVTFTNPLFHDLVGVPLDIKLHPTQLYESNRRPSSSSSASSISASAGSMRPAPSSACT